LFVLMFIIFIYFYIYAMSLHESVFTYLRWYIYYIV